MVRWKHKIRCGKLEKEQPKEEDDSLPSFSSVALPRPQSSFIGLYSSLQNFSPLPCASVQDTHQYLKHPLL